MSLTKEERETKKKGLEARVTSKGDKALGKLTVRGTPT